MILHYKQHIKNIDILFTAQAK